MSHDRSIEMIGGNLALDFANTVGWHAAQEPIEHLERYEDFLAWARRAGVLAAAEVRGLSRRGARGTRERAQAFRQVRELREGIYRVFAAVARGAKPAAKDLAALQVQTADALRAATPEWRRTGVALTWSVTSGLAWPAFPVALAATALLSSPSLDYVRQCDNHPCGWLFLDTSKNHSRRWCTSAECGNNARVRRFRSRATS